MVTRTLGPDGLEDSIATLESIGVRAELVAEGEIGHVGVSTTSRSAP